MHYGEVITDTGTITAYGFACGYVQEKETDTRLVKLYREGSIYHVRAFNLEPWEPILWESTYVLSEARSIFNKAVKNKPI